MLKEEFKIFCIGFNKTGTTTLTRVLNELGFNAIHQGCGWDRVLSKFDDRFDTDWWWGDGNAEILHKYHAFTDGENHNIEKLDQLFPGSKFILNTRSLDSWLKSRIKHRDKRFTNQHIEHSILKRFALYEYLEEYFASREKDFLILNIVEDKNFVEKLTNFLGVVTPPSPVKIPHMNQRKTSILSEYFMNRRIRKIYKSLMLGN